MKMCKLVYILLPLLLQGCSSFFEEKYNDKELFDRVTDLQDIDSSKQETFLSLGTSYLGKEVSYDRQQKKVLDKEINLTTYAPVNIYTVLEMLGEQMEITYKVDASTPQELAEKATAGEDILKNTVYTINFKGNLDEFIGYLSNLYDVSIQLKKNNLLEVNLYSNFAINLDYYGTDNNYEASLDISSNEAASSSGLKGKSTTSFKSSFWADVKDMMDKYISSGVYNIFQDSSILTFVGRQSEYNHVNKVLEQYKQANSRQFVVSYKIYILDKSKSKNLEAELGFSYNSGGTQVGFNQSLLTKLTGSLNANSNFHGGENAKFRLAAQLDAVYNLTGSKILQSGSFITRNNMPIPLNLTKTQHYVSGMTSTKNANMDITENQLTTDQIVTGSSFIITPRALSDGKIEVASGFTRKNLIGIEKFDNVQLPNYTTTEMFNTSVIKPGDLLIVGKYDENTESDGQKAGILSAILKSEDANSTIIMIVGIDNYFSINE
ncbi:MULTISPECIES: hypothetical protein [Providencia]|uniref:Type II and III secretion system protein n=5 Tax=Providencia TaxID=586 RepID=A0AA42FIR4_9GAMM|nr:MULTISPECIES: hypothetical protein [Providencia]APC11920.1 hypothetical protein RB151_022480 [Providencia rettgeri]AVL75237.1 type II and III secretion system protein [Providencia rettgeri]EIU7555007.1 type II and III secretion system protein [Providencia rettgeri]EJD6041361.1 type II and III secretion system protein [Providencia rettgeri]EJD6081082.1 type II and III secretion system protein [Providencia rettgeri]